MPPVRFVVHPIRARRVYHVTPEDVRVVLSRLPQEVTQRLKEVHFNDRYYCGLLGSAHRASGQITLTALPERVSFTHYLDRHGGTVQEFGARLGQQWPVLAIRRNILYDTLLHELGHLQIVRPRQGRDGRNYFAGERGAREFSLHWRRRLWSRPFKHPDPVHNAPQPEERFWSQVSNAWQLGLADEIHGLAASGRHAEALTFLADYQGISRADRLFLLGVTCYRSGNYKQAHDYFVQLAEPTIHHCYWLGLTLIRLRRFNSGWRQLRAALNDPCAGLDARLELARSYYHRGQIQPCEQLVLDGLAEQPDNLRLNRFYLSFLKVTQRSGEVRRQRRRLRQLERQA